MMARNDSDERLRELVLYISWKCEDDPKFGAVKLNKILFLSDFLSYRYRGSAITGAEYMRLDHGPVPRRLLPAQNKLLEDGDIAIKETWLADTLRHPRKQTVALRAPNLELFSGEEIALVDSVITKVLPLNGTQLSEVTHDFIGWRIAGEGETIPYQASLISSEPPSEYVLQRTRELVKEHGW